MKDRLSGRKGRSAYSQRKADPLIFGTKMAPYLWRVDPSVRNSVTGSGSRAKCSNNHRILYLIKVSHARLKLCRVFRFTDDHFLLTNIGPSPGSLPPLRHVLEHSVKYREKSFLDWAGMEIVQNGPRLIVVKLFMVVIYECS